MTCHLMKSGFTKLSITKKKTQLTESSGVKIDHKHYQNDHQESIATP
jgi:hypothetical protein